MFYDRKHVFRDLEPYICLFTDCNLGLHTFRSRTDWMNHEFEVHRVTARWDCSFCSEPFNSQEAFRAHLVDLHDLESYGIGPSQIEGILNRSKQLVSRDASSEKCPFCLSVPGPTAKSFAVHVGKHQQGIALAALPNSGVDNEDSEADSADDDLPAIDDFLRWLHKNKSFSVNDTQNEEYSESDERGAFIPIRAATTYLEEDGRLQEILNAMFHPHGGPEAEIVLPNYVAIFCILIGTGKGTHIEHFVWHGLNDNHLPLDPQRAPANFPPDTGDGTFYQRFCDKQWKFCVPVFERSMDRNFPGKLILPIIKKRLVASDGDATLYEVRIHSSYSKLRLDSNPKVRIPALEFPIN